jgi:hypothetical protein
VQLSTDSTFATTVVNDSTVAAVSRAVGPLGNNTRYYWRVNAKNAGGTTAYSTRRNFTTATVVGILPREFSLQRLNPGGSQSLRFGLPQRARVVIRLFSIRGRMVSQLLNETRDAGYYTVPLSFGLRGSHYLLDFRAGDFHKTMKIHP